MIKVSPTEWLSLICVKALVYLWSRGAGTGFATSFHFRAPAPNILDSRKLRENLCTGGADHIIIDSLFLGVVRPKNLRRPSKNETSIQN